MTDRLTELQDFMFDTMASPEMAWTGSATASTCLRPMTWWTSCWMPMRACLPTSETSVTRSVAFLSDPVPIMTSVQTTTTMRKIESLMNRAIAAGKDWKNANTEVINADGVSSVYLHGNLIAEITDDAMKIFDGGWQSNTTKSRLNALLSAFGHHGECVYQSDWTWYIRLWTGDDYATTEFRSGMRLA